MLKPLIVWITTNWKILKELGVPEHITCLPRNLYGGQEATVRILHRTTNWFKIGKIVQQGCTLTFCLLNFYAEYITTNAWLDESQAGIKIVGRNINNFRYADNTILMAESKEDLNSLLMRVKEDSEKISLKLNIQKTKIMASSAITSWQIEEGKVEAMTNFLFLGSNITVNSDCSHEIKGHFLLGRKAMTNLDCIVQKKRYYFADKGSYSQSYGFSSNHVRM